MYKIRNYQSKDRSAVENICLAKPCNYDLMNKALLDAFCRYYVEYEPKNCFVAANENGKAIGYVFCASDFDTWERSFLEFITKSDNPILKAIAESTIGILKPFKDEYPAHLHIDIHHDYQGKHIGSTLIDALLKHLKSKGVKGVALDVAKDNTGAINFYLKNGFSLLSTSENEIVMGIKL